MDYRELFSSQEFRELLNEYERAEQQGYTPLLSSDDYTDIAEYYHYKGDFDRALQTIDQAIGVYPGALGPLVFRARAALMREENAEKEEKSEKAEPAPKEDEKAAFDPEIK